MASTCIAGSNERRAGESSKYRTYVTFRTHGTSEIDRPAGLFGYTTKRRWRAMAELTLRIDLSELDALAAFVERFAAEESLPAEVAFQLNLVLEELITNTVSYGHPDGSGPP